MKYKRQKSHNQTLIEIFEGYREEIERTLDLQNSAPYRFNDEQFLAFFEKRVEMLDTLLGLYGGLIIARRSRN